MPLPADSLPEDVEALRTLALKMISERDAERAEKEAVAAERDKLMEINDRLRRLLRKAQGFEAKSEKLARLPPDQLNLALEDIEQAIAKSEAIEEKSAPAGEAANRRRKTNRGTLPGHLPRTHETVEPETTNCP